MPVQKKKRLHDALKRGQIAATGVRPAVSNLVTGDRDQLFKEGVVANQAEVMRFLQAQLTLREAAKAVIEARYCDTPLGTQIHCPLAPKPYLVIKGQFCYFSIRVPTIAGG